MILALPLSILGLMVLAVSHFINHGVDGPRVR
jgi:hypothetical protein